MHVISRKALVAFAAEHQHTDVPLDVWYRIIKRSAFENFAQLRRTFNSVDRVGNYYVFDIAGNHVRLIAAIHFDTQTLYIRHVFTHRQYDDWRPA